MEIIYKKDDVVIFDDLECGDAFESGHGIYIKTPSTDDVYGYAVNLKSGIVESFYPNAKVTKKDVILTVN